MPDLHFRIDGVDARPITATPQLYFTLRIIETTVTPIRSVRLQCQVRIQPARRRYESREQDQLVDLFGTPDRWGQTLRDMTWAHVGITVPAFGGETAVELPVPVEIGSESAATRYLDALHGGDVPLCFLFSGWVFYESPRDGSQVAPIPWDREAGFRLPATAWKELTRNAVTP